MVKDIKELPNYRVEVEKMQLDGYRPSHLHELTFTHKDWQEKKRVFDILKTYEKELEEQLGSENLTFIVKAK